MWKQLTHPNIVPLLRASIDPPLLISDWMSGGDLPKYIKNNPDADRIGLVRVLPVVFLPCLLLLLGIRCC